MEQQQVIEHAGLNGVEKNGEMAAPQIRSGTVEIENLIQKRVELVTNLNGLKADREAVAQQLSNMDEGVQRTLGALILINGLIYQLDPVKAKELGIVVEQDAR